MAEAKAWALVGLLVGAGLTHFIKPQPYDTLIPDAMPGDPRHWTYASGVAELVTAASIAHPRTRRLGAYAAVGLFAAVFPANIKMAVDWRHRPPAHRAIAYARLPLQIPLIIWAWRVARRP